LIVDPGQIHVELDGLKIISLENVDWNSDDNFLWSINKTEKDSLEHLQMIFHRYTKSFFISSIILHLFLRSSGSTSFPKPIQYTNRSILNLSVILTDINKKFYTENDTVLAWGAL
jgi:hypothetical protein